MSLESILERIAVALEKLAPADISGANRMTMTEVLAKNPPKPTPESVVTPDEQAIAESNGMDAVALRDYARAILETLASPAKVQAFVQSISKICQSFGVVRLNLLPLESVIEAKELVDKAAKEVGING